MVCDELAQIQLAAGMVDVDSDQVALAVVIQNNAFRNLLALDAWPVRKIDVERICVWKIIQFHGRNLRSKNALCMVSLSDSVTTRKQRPSSSSTDPQKPITVPLLQLHTNRRLDNSNAHLPG